jgi:hypothetical protein
MDPTLNDIVRLQTRAEQRIIQLQRAIDILEDYMSQQLEDLKVKVERAVGAGDSLVELVTGLAAEIRANKGDDAALEEIAARLDSNTQEWVAAVEANRLPTDQPSQDPAVQTTG